MKSVFVPPLCVIQCGDWSWSPWPLRMVLWSCRAPQGEHLDLPFWSSSDLCVTESFSESQLSAGNEITVDSLGRNSELKFFFFHIKKQQKKKGNKRGKVWVIFELENQLFSSVRSKVFGRKFLLAWHRSDLRWLCRSVMEVFSRAKELRVSPAVCWRIGKLVGDQEWCRDFVWDI